MGVRWKGSGIAPGGFPVGLKLNVLGAGFRDRA